MGLARCDVLSARGAEWPSVALSGSAEQENMRTPSHLTARTAEMRRRIALEAARLISEHGIRDFHLAKRKAAERLHVHDEAQLPRNREIEDALREHQRLFQLDEQPQHLRRLRRAALEAMRFLARFEPRLVGAVLEGTADRHSAVCLHLYCETPEQVMLFLADHGVAYAERSRRLRLRRDLVTEVPVLTLARHEVAFDLTLLPRDAIRQAPLDRIDERPMRRGTLATVAALLDEA
jgi:hypothetical protein